MFPIFLIAIGIAVLVFGQRLAVLGAAVGALLGVALVSLIPGFNLPLLSISIPIVLAVLGFFLAGIAKGFVGIFLIAVGALAGGAITIMLLDLFNLDFGLIDWFLALVGAIIGIVLVQRFRDIALIVLSSLIGALLITRGLTNWLDMLENIPGTLLVIVLTGLGILYQGGYLTGRKASTGGKPGNA